MKGSQYIEELIKSMSLKEKAAEMTQLWGENPDGTLMGILRGFHEDKHLAANAGSLLGFNGAERVLEAQRLHIEESAHHIPFLFMTDVIHGYRTVFPSVLGIGATWDPALAEKTASVAAAEAAVAGVHVTFSPMADLVKDARWGRVIESTGEDSYLNELMTAAFVKGYQGEGIDTPLKIASCVKHFVGYGAVEGGRDYDGTQIGDYELYNEYLPAFQAAIDAGCEMLMPAFNTVNGVPCTSSHHLLQDVLRDEMQFKGTIISDCTAVCELIPHGVCETQEEAALLAAHAGIDIEMVSSTFYENLEKLVNENRIGIEEIDDAVRRILTLKDKLGLFEYPYKDADPEKEKELLLCDSHRAVAREAASKSLVLLKNENRVLPIHSTETLALIGPYADSQKLLDIWGLVNGHEEDCVTLKNGLHGYDVTCAQGCHLWNFRHPEESYPSDEAMFEEALALASKSDKIILALGEHPDMSSEAGSRTELTLPGNQIELLHLLQKTEKPIITIIMTGRPLELGEVAECSSALLISWFPGTEGGNGIADILTGKSAPSGRLPMSFPRSIGQEPLYYNHLPTGRPNISGKYQPYANGYIGIEPGPLYPFGYGRTYTEFNYSPVTLSSEKISCPSTEEVSRELLTAHVTLTNTGNYFGTETVQLYLQDVAGTLSRPVRMLKGFSQHSLQPGESCEITFSITTNMLKYYLPGQGLVLEPGNFRVYIGPDSQTDNHSTFSVESMK